MPKCSLVFNFFGMKHLQALMLGFMYAMDKINNMALESVVDMNRKTRKGNIPQERAMEAFNSLIVRYGFIPLAVGRLTIAMLILRVNNKYILLVFTVVEMIVLLIANTVYAMHGFEALQYTYLVVLFVQGVRWPLALNILSKWSTSTTMTLLFWTFKGSMEIISSFFFHIVRPLKGFGIMSVSIYLSVVVKTFFCILWTVFGSGDPIHNIFVSKEELAELREEHKLRMKNTWRQGTPWKKILTTPILYGCFFLHTGYIWLHTWDNNPFVDPFAGYVKEGKWSDLLTFYASTLAAGGVAYGTDFLIRKELTTLNNVRKSAAAISAWGSGCCFVLMGATLGKDVEVTVFYAFNIIFSIVNGFYDSVLVMYTVSPNYLGFTHCIVSSVAYVTLGLRPIVDQTLAKDAFKDPTKAMSYLMFFYGFFVYFTCLAMLLSGNSRRREYDTYKTVPWKEDSIMSFP